MISEYVMALRVANAIHTLPQEAQDALHSGRIREAIRLLTQAGYAHLAPDEAEAERGFADAGFCSAITVVCLDGVIHSNAYPVCSDANCPCHLDHGQASVA